MEDNNVLVEVETNSNDQMEVYEDSSNLMSGLIGLGIGVVGTLLAKKGVNTVKNLWKKSKDKKAAVAESNKDQKNDVIDGEATVVEEDENK